MSSRGFTLTESLLALTLLGLALAAIMPAFLVHTGVNTLCEERSGAVAAAQESLESLRQLDPVTLPSSGSSDVALISVGDRDYEVVVHYCTRDELCGTDKRHVILEVFHGGYTVYTVETVYTRLR
jgi:prepilin-type N-terminal cleavage/methylation domain-containing protein